MTQVGQDRWVEVSPFRFPYGAEGLAPLRKTMSDETPLRTWSNFVFRNSQGRWHKVYLALGRGRLHLIGPKYYSGALDVDDQRRARARWRPEDSPLKFTLCKAQDFGSKLQVWVHKQRVRILDERAVVQFLGQGSTAVGLLVHDQLSDGVDAECALKIAHDADAVGRLKNEAEVLRQLGSLQVKVLQDRLGMSRDPVRVARLTPPPWP
ncbi:hypothetical protein Val02_57000 [Virgisporangium aliadipatigenens]|uniref:Protein kinase domain-containing protein n=1 Tax=Virgisporangium aliadipatigenens TaxID=741659 RepID=A0A8J3YNH3_9ACTN|nr:hypothetical protein [Virgisporangium aliadipatigenens]GIJ48814.1 hypothetical protein Val02_57000 [Virgisporangium aliadipatigenens]